MHKNISQLHFFFLQLGVGKSELERRQIQEAKPYLIQSIRNEQRNLKNEMEELATSAYLQDKALFKDVLHKSNCLDEHLYLIMKMFEQIGTVI